GDVARLVVRRRVALDLPGADGGSGWAAADRGGAGAGAEGSRVRGADRIDYAGSAADGGSGGGAERPRGGARVPEIPESDTAAGKRRERAEGDRATEAGVGIRMQVK